MGFYMETIDLDNLNATIKEIGIDNCEYIYEHFKAGNSIPEIDKTFGLGQLKLQTAISAFTHIATFLRLADEYCRERFSIGADECGLESTDIVLAQINENAHPCDYVTEKANKWGVNDLKPEIHWGVKYGFCDDYDWTWNAVEP